MSKLMKKALFIVATIISLTIFLSFSIFTFLSPPMEHKYVSEDGTAYIVLKNNYTFEFNYSLLSSTIPTGKYTQINNQVYCYDNSAYSLKFVFDINKNSLIFDAALSSQLPSFSKVKDGSVFLAT